VSDPKILFVGPGAIGASLAAWLAETYPAVFIMGHGESQAALRQNGITIYTLPPARSSRRWL
jgi:ketopantoate reductase